MQTHDNDGNTGMMTAFCVIGSPMGANRCCKIQEDTTFRNSMSQRYWPFLTQALCINSEVTKLKSAAAINERCLELQKPAQSQVKVTQWTLA